SRFEEELRTENAYAGATVSLNVFMRAQKLTANSDSGFDYMVLGLPSGFGVPANIRLSSAPDSGALVVSDVLFKDYSENRDYNVKISGSDLIVTFKSGSAFRESDSSNVFKVSFDVSAPSDPFVGEVKAKVFDSGNPAIELEAFWSDVIAEVLTNSMLLETGLDLSADDLADDAYVSDYFRPLVGSVLAESTPEEAETGAQQTADGDVKTEPTSGDSDIQR
ncbi:MAG: hypothetical protein HQL31_09460, partial [Planctomycetes bacterium]|nr:hypothetical protein [Planctomycetota bacterium]